MKKLLLLTMALFFGGQFHPIFAQNTNTVAGNNAYQNGTAAAEHNCAYGYWSMHANNLGDQNTAMGSSSMVANTSGNLNTALGALALNGNSTGSYNTAVGAESMLGFGHNTNRSSALGYQTLWGTQANDNNAFGYWSQRFNQTGSHNASFGSSSLEKNTSGSYNAAFGNYALYKNKVDANSAFGYYAAFNNETGANNCAFGANTLSFNLSGNLNTALGVQALMFAAKSNNLAAGAFAGKNGADANNCSFLGYATDVVDSKLVYSNSTALGNSARISGSNQVSVGNVAVTSIGGFAGWTNFSDGRFKTDVVEDVPGLEFITKLRPVTYRLDAQGIAKYLGEDHLDSLNAAEYPAMLTLANNARDAKAKQLETGFIAQEVEEAAKSIGYDFSGVDKPQNETDLYGLRYAAFTVPLVKAVQELAKENQSLKQQYKTLQAQNDAIMLQNAEILKRFESLEAQSAGRNADKNETLQNPASLLQNMPNPFDQNTSIQMTVPENATRAALRITNEKGSVVKEIAIAERGLVNVNLSAGTLNAGVYYYTLLVDGQKVETKKMVLVR